ncbi:MAG: hypothetical protein SGPRY_013218 [Prymnesium sp.]
MSFSVSLRLMDLIFFERSLAPLFRFTLALLVENQKKLLALKGSDLVSAAKSLPKNLDNPDYFLLYKAAMLRMKLPAGFYTQVDGEDPLQDIGPTYAPYTRVDQAGRLHLK